MREERARALGGSKRRNCVFGFFVTDPSLFHSDQSPSGKASLLTNHRPSTAAVSFDVPSPLSLNQRTPPATANRTDRLPTSGFKRRKRLPNHYKMLTRQKGIVVGVVQLASRPQEPPVLVLHHGVHRPLREPPHAPIVRRLSPRERGRQARHLGRTGVAPRRSKPR